jgi:cation diffusion facilitator CzcD-associated flavoprotein CzcO
VTRTSGQRIVIVGAGLGGIAAAIEFSRNGFDDITLLERAGDLGGTWYYNSYPGAACDVPSHLYSYSFAKRRDWSRLCSPQQEILDYVHTVARDHGITERITFNANITACTWDDDGARWTLTSEDGRTWDADAVILATGQLHQPAYPMIKGRESFTGHSFHSAQWDHDYDLAGKRVAVIGTGASAVQFVPEIVDDVAHLDVFQRTGNWFLPRKNRPYPAPYRALIKYVPGLQAYRRRFIYNYGESLTLMIRHPRTLGLVGRMRSGLFMRAQLRNRKVRRQAWPHYTFGCKRVLFSSHFLPALQKPNVSLITERIAAMTPTGIVTEDGAEHEVDCVIYGTGFRTNDFMFPMEITGAGGTTLRDAWADGAHAYLGMTVPGFPSLFIMYGPNTNTSGGSIIVYEEAQAAYIRQALQYVSDHRAAAVDVRSEVETASNREIQAAFAGTAWARCDSWYRDEQGRIVANWPGYMREYERRLKTFQPSDFRLVPAPDRSRTPVPA